MINYTEPRPPTDSPSNATSTSVGVFCHDRRGLSVRCRAGGSLHLRWRDARIRIVKIPKSRASPALFEYMGRQETGCWAGRQASGPQVSHARRCARASEDSKPSSAFPPITLRAGADDRVGLRPGKCLAILELNETDKKTTGCIERPD